MKRFKSSIRRRMKGKPKEIISSEESNIMTKDEPKCPSVKSTDIDNLNNSTKHEQWKKNKEQWYKGLYDDYDSSPSSSDNEDCSDVEKVNKKIHKTPAADNCSNKRVVNKNIHESKVDNNNQETSNDKENDSNLMIVAYDFIAELSNEVTVLLGQSVRVLDKSDKDWWLVEVREHQKGLVPSSYLAAKPKIPERKSGENIKKILTSIKDINMDKSRHNIVLPSKNTIERHHNLARVAPFTDNSCNADFQQDPYLNEFESKSCKRELDEDTSKHHTIYNYTSKASLYSNDSKDVSDSGYSGTSDTYSGISEAEKPYIPRFVRRRSISERQKQTMKQHPILSYEEQLVQKYLRNNNVDYHNNVPSYNYSKRSSWC